MNTDETPILRYECPLDSVTYTQPAKCRGKAPTVEMRLVAILPDGHRRSVSEMDALRRGVAKRVLAKLNPAQRLRGSRLEEKLRGAVGALSSVGALASHTEATLPRPGWYWFVAKHGYMIGGTPRFVQVDEDNIKHGELKCRKYAGTYRGPLDVEALLGK